MINWLYMFAANPAKCGKDFFGLKPWFEYIKLENDCSVRDFKVLGSNSDIPAVLLVVVDNLLRIAGLVAVAFIIYGAVQYATSQGDPEQTNRAKSSIINALIGLGVAIISIGLVTFLGTRISS